MDRKKLYGLKKNVTTLVNFDNKISTFFSLLNVLPSFLDRRGVAGKEGKAKRFKARLGAAQQGAARQGKAWPERA